MTAGKKKISAKIPNWLCRYVSEAGLTKISEAVAKVESLTRAEIIPMVVRRSSPKGHARQSVFLFLMVLGLIFFIIESFDFLDEIPGGVYSQIGFVTVLSFLLAIPLAKLDFFIGKFVSINDQRRAVHLRAEHEFYSQHFDKTADHSAVLIFISMMERRVVVLADSGISEKVDPRKTHEVWAELAQIITSSLKKKDLASGLSKAIEKAGALTAEHLPMDAAQNKKNEISNDLIILE